jgi:hypothetical protein
LLQIVFIFYPSHVWVKGNEPADRLAGTAGFLFLNGRAMEHAYILHFLEGEATVGWGVFKDFHGVVIQVLWA